jgi:hypothetical protein
MIVRLNDTHFAMVEEPHHTPLLDRLADLRMRLQRHL